MKRPYQSHSQTGYGWFKLPPGGTSEDTIREEDGTDVLLVENVTRTALINLRYCYFYRPRLCQDYAKPITN